MMMISHKQVSKATMMKLAIQLASLCHLLLLYPHSLEASNQLYRLDEAASAAASAANDLHSTGHMLAPANQQNHHNIPGHYAFEMAPKMEPPSVRKPPYPQSTQICPGLDPFSGFSPKDSLCGDLNQGRVPINPLGQSIGDQSYPFELIKNKTLQFLARALPVLKLEYETIPKVARYLPSNQILNPTHQASPLSQEHMQLVNQRFATANGFAPDDYFGAPYLANAGGGTKRRKKRSLSTGQGSIRPALNHPSGILIAEMSPNATLVVSSAHSSTGRIQSLAARSNSVGDSNELAVITKDGYKPVTGPSVSRSNPPPQQQQQQQTTQRQQNSYNFNNWPSTSNVPLSNPNTNQENRSQKLVQSLAQQGGKNVSNKSPTSQQTVVSSSTNVNGNNGDRQQNGYTLTFQHHNQQPQQQQVVANSSQLSLSHLQSQQQQQTVAVGHNSQHATISNSYRTNEQQGQIDGDARSSGSNTDANSQSPTSSPTSAAAATSVSVSNSGNYHGNSNGHQQQQHQVAVGALAKQDTFAKRRLTCGDSSNGFTSAICQAASALIEGDRPPAWLQFVKHLGNAYSGASSDSILSSSSNSGASIWSLLSNLAQQQQESSSAKSSSNNLGSSSSSSKVSSIMSILGPISALLSGSGVSSGNSAASSNLVAAKESESQPEVVSQPIGKEVRKEQNKQHEISPFASSLATALGSSTMTKLALAGWASNAIASLVEYFVPSVFQSFSQSRSFSRRKKPYDSQEQFVDTPASMAAAALTNSLPSGRQQMMVQAGFGQQQSQQQVSAKQPPTPCPSVEEYISPTFARNYQGAWKYVVQIPHEGYFTQTIQRTSCVKQKCEFTEGICHESPRWVSLLVAEIYYPNTIFGSSQQQQQQLQQPSTGDATSLNINPQQPLAASSSISSIHSAASGALPQHPQFKSTSSSGVQDPLQMTDSLSNYNHNLNNAFISAANELGWDPNNLANMQQLANAYNYQLMQRNGLMTNQQQAQQPQIENRQGSANTQSQFTTNQQQQQQLYSNQPIYNTDYITALAAATLQQNPHMNIQELISSLQLQQQQSQVKRRKRRDTTATVGAQTRLNRSGSNQYQVTANQLAQQMAQHRSSIESAPSINDINSQHVGNSQQQQQQSNQYKQQLEAGFSTLHNQQSQSIVNQQQANNEQVSAAATATTTTTGTSGNQQQQTANESGNSGAANQVECDGHDKLGCYVVRVYYDWFLVNGSCKCWKTTSQNNGQSSSSSSSSSGNGGNSFLRRIFTG